MRQQNDVAGSVEDVSPARAQGSVDCVGIVITLPDALAGPLEQWRASFGDPMASIVPAHITLVTTTPVLDWNATLRHARNIARQQESFRITLRGTETFRPVSPVVYLKVDEGFGECVALHKRLQSGPLARVLDFPFHPHTTIAHDVSDAGMSAALTRLADYEESFDVATMGLYEHDVDGVWRLREELRFGRLHQEGDSPER